MPKKNFIIIYFICIILCSTFGAGLAWVLITLFTLFGYPRLGWFIGLCFVIIMLIDILVTLAIGYFSLDDKINDNNTSEDI